jgi:thiol-disulfide isomerase/thioredoxin
MKLLKFGAAWCSPCVAFKRTVDQVLKEFPHVELVEVNIETDEGKQLATEHRITSVPTLVMNGKTLRGNVSAGLVKQFLTQ